MWFQSRESKNLLPAKLPVLLRGAGALCLGIIAFLSVAFGQDKGKEAGQNPEDSRVAAQKTTSAAEAAAAPSVFENSGLPLTQAAFVATQWAAYNIHTVDGLRYVMPKKSGWGGQKAWMSNRKDYCQFVIIPPGRHEIVFSFGYHYTERNSVPGVSITTTHSAHSGPLTVNGDFAAGHAYVLNWDKEGKQGTVHDFTQFEPWDQTQEQAKLQSVPTARVHVVVNPEDKSGLNLFVRAYYPPWYNVPYKPYLLEYDGTKIANLDLVGQFSLGLPAGQHRLSAGKSSLSVDLQEGQDYYCSVDFGYNPMGQLVEKRATLKALTKEQFESASAGFYEIPGARISPGYRVATNRASGAAPSPER